MKNESVKFDLEGIRKTDKTSWLAKITNDLKGKDPNDLCVFYDQNIKIDPFSTTEDRSFLLGALEKSRKGWFASVSFLNEIEEVKLNSRLLNYLNDGLESFRIRVNRQTEVEKIYKGIFPGFVYNDVTFEEETNFDGFCKIMEKSTNGMPQGCLNLKSFHKIEIPSLSEFHHYSISINAREDRISQLINGMKKIDDLLNKGVDSKNIRIEIVADDHLINNVLTARSARVLWNNLLTHHGLKVEPVFIFFNAEPVLLTKSTEELLIAASNVACAAAVSTADMISLIPFTEDSEENARLGLNIHHIYKLESNLDKVTDPLNGSFVIENTTHQICEEVWDKM